MLGFHKVGSTLEVNYKLVYWLLGKFQQMHVKREAAAPLEKGVLRDKLINKFPIQNLECIFETINNISSNSWKDAYTWTVSCSQSFDP